jgi:predicted RNA-binding Zn-ribbon protein involved in translation (DUF1610 family)
LSGSKPMLCASCSSAIHARRTAHGLVWICDACGTGAATLAVLRRAVPRGFVQHLWQAALGHGRPSAQRCPSCTQPLLDFADSPVMVAPVVSLCRRCYFVVFEKAALGIAPAHSPAPARAFPPANR